MVVLAAESALLPSRIQMAFTLGYQDSAIVFASRALGALVYLDQRGALQAPE